MKRNLAVLLALAGVVAACGGGGGDEVAAAPAPAASPAAAAAPMVPESINASIASFTGYLLALAGVTDSMAEALDVSLVNAPVSDSAEPSALP